MVKRLLEEKLRSKGRAVDCHAILLTLGLERYQLSAIGLQSIPRFVDILLSNFISLPGEDPKAEYYIPDVLGALSPWSIKFQNEYNCRHAPIVV